MSEPQFEPSMAPVPDFTARAFPPHTAKQGRYAKLEPLDPVRHRDALWEAMQAPGSETIWTYLPYGPFDEAGFESYLADFVPMKDPQFYALCDLDKANGAARGVGTLMRITPDQGVIEMGHIWMSLALQRTRAATEALFLMMERALTDLGYRRLEWKCNAANAASRRAAERFGFTYEGTFRQHMVIKGCNRDTAWLSILDSEWPSIREGFLAWLDPDNFDAEGRQKAPLATRG